MNKLTNLSVSSEKSFDSERTIFLKKTPLETTEIEQSLLNIENKNRSNPLTWNGQFSPQLVEVLLNKYSLSDFVVFDPFAGSGTILYECGRKNISAVATEINPAAYYMASIYKLINVSIKMRYLYVSKIEDILYSLFSNDYYKNSMFENITNIEDVELQKKILNLLASVKDENLNFILKAFVIKLDFYQQKLNNEKLFQVWKKLKQLIIELPFSERLLSIYNNDARKSTLKRESVDLVITSPPYINVFNYHQQYRTSTEALGWNLLEVAKSEIGSNRKHRGNRFLTVIQYCLDIAQVFAHLATLCKKNARLIFIVGRESKVRGKAFFNGDIVSLIATKCLDSSLIIRQEREFKNRFGECIVEDILHFSSPKKIEESKVIERAKNIASIILEKSLDNVCSVVKNDIENALEKLPEIKPSQIYDPIKAFNG